MTFAPITYVVQRVARLHCQSKDSKEKEEGRNVHNLFPTRPYSVARKYSSVSSYPPPSKVVSEKNPFFAACHSLPSPEFYAQCRHFPILCVVDPPKPPYPLNKAGKN